MSHYDDCLSATTCKDCDTPVCPAHPENGDSVDCAGGGTQCIACARECGECRDEDARERQAEDAADLVAFGGWLS